LVILPLYMNQFFCNSHWLRVFLASDYLMFMTSNNPDKIYLNSLANWIDIAKTL